jgi:hypothetical protein
MAGGILDSSVPYTQKKEINLANRSKQQALVKPGKPVKVRSKCNVQQQKKSLKKQCRKK